MKKIIALFLVTAILLCSGVTTLSSLAFESRSNRLITVGGKTVTDDMTLDDVIELFGEPKLTTGSMFGGKACTFYGNNYSDYLYIETFEDGSIASYGSISPDFETDTLSYGDTADNIVRYEYNARDQNNKVFGLIRYRNFQSGLIDEYFANAVENNMNLCKHAVEMWNAVSYLYGYNTPTRFDEQTFYISQQLADNYSDLDDYCWNTNQNSYFNSIGGGTYFWCDKYQYPNPLMFADGAIYYECPDEFPAEFIVRETTNDTVWQSGGFVNPELFKEKKIVAYTSEEKELLKKVRETYLESVNTYNAGYDEGYYEVEPKFESLPLVGGRLNEKVAIGAVDFLNAIRIGARLEPLEYSRELSESAQWKATLTRYITKQGISNPNPHFPAKPDGVSDEFYQKTMLGSGENLFMCGFLSTSVIGSLQYALDDGYGDGEYYSRGHRYNLLDPNWVEIGVGNAEQQGCHKMSGYREADVEVVAWPSNGIMLAESMVAAKTMYTCQFYNGLRADDKTVVTLKCLNTGKTWRIDKSSLTSDQDFSAAGELISYYDATIAFSVGNVYEITFENLLNTDGKRVDYTYRSVYEKAYVNSDSDVPKTLTLSNASLKLEKGASQKIKATVTPNTATNMMVKWSSSAPSVASVNENGIVTAKSSGSAVITAITEDGQIKATCTVQVCANHVWNSGSVTKAATCAEEGIRSYSCTVCNSQKDEVIPLTGTHTWDSGRVTDEPSTTSTGNMIFTCTVCQTTKIQSIPALTTNAGSVVTNPPVTTTLHPIVTTLPPTTTSPFITTPLTPVTTPNPPITGSTPPVTTPNVPVTTTTASITIPIVPAVTTTAQIPVTNIPITTLNALETTLNAPETTPSMPETTLNAPETTPNAPETTLNTPETTPNVPETTLNTPETTPNSADTPLTQPVVSGSSVITNEGSNTTVSLPTDDSSLDAESDMDWLKTSLYIVIGLVVAISVVMIIIAIKHRKND